MKFLHFKLRCALLIAVSFFATRSYVAAQTYEQSILFNTVGSTNWSLPTDVKVLSVTIEAIGGGGAGGYVKKPSTWNFNFQTSGGGSGAAYAKIVLNKPTQGQEFVIYVGAGGSNSSGTSSNGENSFVNMNGSAIVRAAGGTSVSGTNNRNGATAQDETESIGDLIHKGGNGSGAYSTTKAGHGGGAGGSSSAGGNATAPTNWNDGSVGASGGGDAGSGGKGTKTGTSWPGDAPSGEDYGGGGAGAWCTGEILGLIPNSGKGGPGAQGCVRITYTYVEHSIEVADQRDTVCSGAEYVPTFDVDLFKLEPADTRYTWNAPTSSNVTGMSAGTNSTSFTQTLTNTTTTMQSLVYEVIASNNGFADTFNVTVVVYPEVVAGAISKDQLVCQNLVIDQIVSDTDPSGSTLTTPCFWQVSYDGGTTWTAIADANLTEYTPTTSVLSSVNNLVRRGYAALCDTVYSNVVTLTNPNPLSPGSISVTTGNPAGTYCRVDVDAELSANPSANPDIATPPFSYQWQESYDGGTTWSDISGATGATYSVYLHPVTDTVSYRYQVKYDTCSWMISNNTYDIIYQEDPDYSEQIDTVWITLYYGASDTVFANVPAPTLIPTPVSILPDFDGTTRHGEGIYTINWKVTLCNEVAYDQVVVVQYPPCGTTDFAEDYEGNRYPVVNVGRNCWLAENLRSTKYFGGSDIPSAEGYYSVENLDRDANARKYGRLYTWYSALNVPEGDNAAAPAIVNGPTGDYVQGACPKGWAVPTQEEFAQLMAAASDASNLKSSDPSTWLPGKEGVSPGIGFDAPGAGFYNIDTKRYENLLAEAYFWTSSTGASVQQGVCDVLTHSCPSTVSEQNMKGMGFSLRCVKKE